MDAYSIPGAGAGITGNVLYLNVFHVLEAGEILQALAGTNNVLVLTINGEENTL
jgi:hypothetical protein